MCSKLLKRRDEQPWLYRKTEPFFIWLTNQYASALGTFMQRRWLAFVILAVSIALIAFMSRTIPSELSPLEDRSEFRVMAQGAEGATFEYMDGYILDITNFLQHEIPEASGLVSVTAPGFGTMGVNSGLVRVILKPSEERTRSQQQIVDDITEKAKQFSGVRTYLTQTQTIGADRRGDSLFSLSSGCHPGQTTGSSSGIYEQSGGQSEIYIC